MTICLGNSCSFGLLCVSFMNVYQFVCVSFPFGLMVGCGIDCISSCSLPFFSLFPLSSCSLAFLSQRDSIIH